MSTDPFSFTAPPSRVVATYEELEADIRAGDERLGGDVDAAYDGSTEPQLRDLTARERDVLCRVISDHLRLIRDGVADQEPYGRLQLIRHIIDPRRDH